MEQSAVCTGSMVIALGQVLELARATLQAVCQRVCRDFNDIALLTELGGLEI